jgi:hypothetical protein
LSDNLINIIVKICEKVFYYVDKYHFKGEAIYSTFINI